MSQQSKKKETIKISLRDIEKNLRDSRVPENEIPTILKNVELLQKVGISSKDLDLVLNSIIKDSNLRGVFLKDYRAVLKKVGIDPQPSP